MVNKATRQLFKGGGGGAIKEVGGQRRENEEEQVEKKGGVTISGAHIIVYHGVSRPPYTKDEEANQTNESNKARQARTDGGRRGIILHPFQR